MVTATRSKLRGAVLRAVPNWTTLKFEFTQTDHIFVATADETGTWRQGHIRAFGDLSVSPAAAVFNYGQAVFEGMKAQLLPDGQLVLFRPEENARRFRNSAARLQMPPYPTEEFLRAVNAIVRKEARWVPPCAYGSLYIRPVMIGSGAVLGVAPAPTYTFYIFVSPVGLYRQGDPRLIVMDSVHRAAPYGIGNIKASANYAGTLRIHHVAAEHGYKDVLYLDARHDRYVEEVGSSNFFAILRDGTLVTPLLGSILPGITRDSVITIARELLHWHVVERELAIEEVLTDAQEAFFTGTARSLFNP